MIINFIFLDICGTLVPFQTADVFIEYVLNNSWKKYLLKILYLLGRSKVLTKFGYKRKFISLKLLNGMTRIELNIISKKFVEENLIPNLNNKILDFIKENKSKVIIISGGYDIYLKYLKEYIHAEELVCTRLKFENNKFIGKIEGIDCVGINKIILLKENNLLNDIIFEETAIFADSFSDLPIFALGKYKFILNPDNLLKILNGNIWHDFEKYYKKNNKINY